MMPVGATINGAYARVERAEKHLDDLRTEISALHREQANAVLCEFDTKIPYDLKVSLASPFPMPPVTIGLLIGEICYNLRSAMDFLVYNLAWLDSGSPVDGTQFPIESAEKNFATRKDTWLKGINPTHIALLEILQPYNGTKFTERLRNLSNWDKHRDFVRIAGDIGASGVAQWQSGFDDSDGAVRRAIHPLKGEVNVKVDFSAHVQFEDGAPIIETLQIVKSCVRETLDIFKSDFG